MHVPVILSVLPCPEGSAATEVGRNFIAEFVRSFEHSAFAQRFRLTDDPEEAGLILFLESYKHKFRQYVRELQAHPWISRYPEKCFTYNWEDGPIGLLPGVYVSLERSKVDPRRHRAGGYIGTCNPLITGELPGEVVPRMLLSFRGSASHPVRQRLYELPSHPRCRIERTTAWFNHTAEQLRAYRDEIAESKFVLCPRGVGPTSWRLFETMAMGRVPVIISDDWLAPSDIPWDTFSLRLREDECSEVIQRVEVLETHWPGMAAAAWRVFHERFSRQNGLGYVLESVLDLQHARPSNFIERSVQESWNTIGFAWRNGWTLPQRISRVAFNSTLLSRVKKLAGVR